MENIEKNKKSNTFIENALVIKFGRKLRKFWCSPPPACLKYDPDLGEILFKKKKELAEKGIELPLMTYRLTTKLASNEFEISYNGEIIWKGSANSMDDIVKVIETQVAMYFDKGSKKKNQ
jgi:hypothetical protein